MGQIVGVRYMEQNYFGFWGRILRVDLASCTWTIEEPDPMIYRLYGGGRALALYFLLREMPPGVDPLSPQNKLIMMTSPVTGYPISGPGRHTIACLSALTGGLADSQCGGYWGAELKHAGWDGIIIEGAADQPVYISVEDDSIQIRSAEHLHGKTTGEAQAILRQSYSNKARILQIGPAGENIVRFALVTSDLRNFSARGGTGAVMGSKNLRAIIVKGSYRKLKAAFPEKLKELAMWFARSIENVPGLRQLAEFGTAGGVVPSSLTGNLPTFNHQDSSFSGAERISGEALREALGAGSERCYACSVACKRVIEGSHGDTHISKEYGGPEYESIASLGSQLGIDDIWAIAKANELCNSLGMDTISAGVTISWAIECFERGLLTDTDTGGITLAWNDPQTLLKLLPMIAYRQGFGALLAEGSKRAAEYMGRNTEQYAMHVKGQEMPAHEPRGKWGVGLGFGVSPTGADHLQAAHDPHFSNAVYSKVENRTEREDLSQVGIIETVPLEDLSPAKVRLFVYQQYIWALHDVLDWCVFVTKTEFLHFRLQQLVEAVRYITGWRTNAFELLKAGERAVTMARAFNCREGFSADDDYLPERMYTPVRAGTLKGHFIDRNAYEQALKLYYGMMGWNEDGVPQKSKLEELGIGWIWEKIYNPLRLKR